MATRQKSKSTSSASSSSGAAKGTALQSAIASKGYNWTAGATAVSELSANERRARLGLKVEDSEVSAMTAAIRASEQYTSFSTAAFGAPAAIDWRNNGGDWTTPIKDQGTCGACVSFATCATIESRVNIVCKNPSLDRNLSEAHLFFCGCGNCCGNGWNFAPALNFARDTGVANDSDFPYTPSNQPCKAGVPIQFKIKAWSSVLPVAERKNIIATKGPVVAGMAVFTDFFSYKTGVYRHVSGVLEGYHAVSVVGYDDAQRCWIAKNSWGTGWGENGWFKIAYGQSIDTEFPYYDVDVDCPTPAPTSCEQYVAVLRRVLEAARTNRQLRMCLRFYICGKLPRVACSESIMRVVRSVAAILRLCPQYRRAFCNALG
jgi:C1A family cysteine protease